MDEQGSGPTFRWVPIPIKLHSTHLHLEYL